jgi:hypothetical protein
MHFGNLSKLTCGNTRTGPIFPVNDVPGLGDPCDVTVFRALDNRFEEKFVRGRLPPI